MKKVVLNSDDFNIRAIVCANLNLVDESFLADTALNDDYGLVTIACVQNHNLYGYQKYCL